jgi:hypothetical protein
VPIEISNDVAEVEWQDPLIRDHPAKHFAQRPRPVSQQRNRTPTDGHRTRARDDKPEIPNGPPDRALPKSGRA